MAIQKVKICKLQRRRGEKFSAYPLDYLTIRVFVFIEGLFCRNQMVQTIYTDMDERAKKVADMDRSARMNVVWDLAEEFKVI